MRFISQDRVVVVFLMKNHRSQDNSPIKGLYNPPAMCRGAYDASNMPLEVLHELMSVRFTRPLIPGAGNSD